MCYEPLAMGIDLGTSGVRLALINKKLELIYSSTTTYNNSLENCKDWEIACKKLILEIPKSIKSKIVSCSIDGTSGTIVACNKNGIPLGEAIAYHKSFNQNKQNISMLISNNNQGDFSSLGRALYLIKKFGNNILLRHQADWISSWLTSNWDLAEEGNNLKLGWNISKQSWPEAFKNQPWKNALPCIQKSGSILGQIDIYKSKILGLPKNLLIIAGTTDSNAAVVATNASKDDGITILGSTIVLKKFVPNPIEAEGITNHFIGEEWLCGGSSNAGGSVLKKFFLEKEIEEISSQINPELSSGIKLLPLPFVGERFPINDPSLKPIMNPRPISDALYLHAIFEGFAEIEKKGWEKLIALGVNSPKKIITIGQGARNIQWQKIRERILKIPTKKSSKFPAIGAAMIALKVI